MEHLDIDQDLNNLKVIEKKILEAVKKGDFETADIWRDAAEKTLDRMLYKIKKLGKPLTITQQLYKNGLEL